jgi:hypothetical protein
MAAPESHAERDIECESHEENVFLENDEANAVKQVRVATKIMLQYFDDQEFDIGEIETLIGQKFDWHGVHKREK